MTFYPLNKKAFKTSWEVQAMREDSLPLLGLPQPPKITFARCLVLFHQAWGTAFFAGLASVVAADSVGAVGAAGACSPGAGGAAGACSAGAAGAAGAAVWLGRGGMAAELSAGAACWFGKGGKAGAAAAGAAC